MIYTVTLNPSIDAHAYLDSVNLGKLNIAQNQDIYLGGKGFNVSRVLTTLGSQNVALGFLAGDTGELCEKLLAKEGMAYQVFFLNKGQTRINFKIHGTEETEINGKGPEASEEDIKKLTLRLKTLGKDDVLILSGSVLKNLGDDAYKRILMEVSDEVLVVVDANKKLLLESLMYRPFLIKPNIHELEEICKRKILSDDDILDCMKMLQNLGAKNVLTSLGKDGAVLLTQNGDTYIGKAKADKVISTTAAGDSMVAGFISTYVRFKDFTKAFALSIACGSACAYSPGLPDREKIKEVLSGVKVVKL